MGLCGSSRCGCGLTVGDGLDLTGSGEPGDPWVLGKVQVAGAFSGTTNATTSALVVTHNLNITTTHTVVIQPISPNGSAASNRWTGWNVTSVSADSFTIGRCVSQDGTGLTSTAVTGRFIAVPH